MEHPTEPTADESLGRHRAAGSGRALSDPTYDTWFAYAEPRSLSDDGCSSSTVPNDFTRDWIESHFHELRLERGARRGRTRASPSPSPSPSDPLAQPRPATARPCRRDEREREQDPGFREGPEVELNPKYTFDLFVIGSSNRFAHAAALAVAEAPAQAYNPLFIYGGTGLGKTHLLQAIGHYVRQHSRRLTMRYVTSETFMNDFIDSLRDKRIEGFKRRYRNYDVLLIDDIQFFEGKERIQEEFFHTFNSLYEGGAQIIISSDRPPREIATLEERLRSRFEWGLLTDIQPPDLETRIAILRKKVNTERIAVTDPEVLTFIAGRVSSNIRELEGALTRVVAFSSLTDRPMTVDLAEHVLKDVFPQGERRPRGHDPADPGGRVRAVRRHARRARQPAPLAGGRVPAAGRDVPLTRAHGLLASEDRQGVRRPRPHDRHPREVQDHAAHPRGPLCVQPCARVDRAHQAGTLDVGVLAEPPRRLWTRVDGRPHARPHAVFPLTHARIRPSSTSFTLLLLLRAFSLSNEYRHSHRRRAPRHLLA